MSKIASLAVCICLGSTFLPALAEKDSAGSVEANVQQWRDPTLSPDQRADLLLKAMSQDEKLRLVFGEFGSMMNEPRSFKPSPEARMGSAGFVPGIPRLGVPPQWSTNASLGVATQRESAEPYRERTALPSSLATASTFDSELARRGGAMIGSEARDSGFNVMLAGGVNLLREPRNGRNFEYAGEDPLLAGRIVGAAIDGIQSAHVVSTVKHFALNDQETGRSIASVKMAEDQARMSDLLAFEIAIEEGKPGSAMCSYNRIDAIYACENKQLLDILKSDWAYPGFVMSDWGAVHSTEQSALAGLDQQSAWVFDREPYFGEKLKLAVAEGRVPQQRLDDMARRIVRSMFAAGLMDHPVAEKPIAHTADRAVSQAVAEQAIVLLRNEGNILPLTRSARRVVVIGGHADRGVLSGGGSSTVFPLGGNAVPGLGPKGFPGPIVYLPSPPLKSIAARLAKSKVTFLSGEDRAAAVKAAKRADVVIVFAGQWARESEDSELSLDSGQDELIEAVASANKRTVVVLETGGPVLMPWLERTAAVLEAWYPGSGGGEAIARVLFGEVDASGRLAATFPASVAQLPHPALPGAGPPANTPFDIEYTEGAAVGYKWFDTKGLKPLFPFGYGLSYTSFAYSDLAAEVKDGRLRLSFKVTNTGRRQGQDVPQLYIGPKAGGWEAPRRLVGWSKVDLLPGTSATVGVTVDPRLLSTFDTASRSWKTAEGDYVVSLGASSVDLKTNVSVRLAAVSFPVRAARNAGP